MEEEPLAERLLEQAMRAHPNSPGVMRARTSAWLSARRYNEVVRLLTPLVEQGVADEETRFMWLLARHAREGMVDPTRFLDEVRQQVPARLDWAVMLSAEELLRLGRPESCIDLILGHSFSEEHARHAAPVVLRAVERLLLGRRDAEGRAFVARLGRGVEFALSQLAAHPADAACRRRFVELLSRERSGSLLVRALAGLVFSSDRSWEDVKPRARRVVSPMADEHFPAVMKATQARNPIVSALGVGAIPDGLPCSPEEVFSALQQLLTVASYQRDAGERGAEQLLTLLHVTLIFARAVGEPNDDLRLRAMVAAGLSATGDFKTGRDLAETTLLGVRPSDSSQRRRVAWLGFADHAMHANNIPEALLGLALVGQCPLDDPYQDELFRELHLAVRILRELDQDEPALALVAQLRAFAKAQGLEASSGHQVEFLEHGLHFRRLTADLLAHQREPGGDAEPLARAYEQLCDQLVVTSRRALLADGEHQPGMVMLAQLLLVGPRFGLQAPERVRREFEEMLPSVGEHFRQVIATLAEPRSDAAALEPYEWGMDRLGRTEQVGQALVFPEGLARWKLADAVTLGEPERALHLLEWSMDRAVRTLDEASKSGAAPASRSTDQLRAWLLARLHGPERERPLSPELTAQMIELARSEMPTVVVSRRPPTAESCARFVRDLSQRGIAVHVFGFDGEGALVRVTAVQGALSAHREPKGVFDAKALNAWSSRYPAGYLEMDTRDFDGLSRVEDTMRGIGIGPGLEASPTLLVPSVELQQIPPNLLLIDGMLAGVAAPVASVPSLTWLRGAVEAPRVPAGRRGAWIPSSDDTEQQGTLALLRAEVEGCLRDHGIDLSCDDLPPEALSGADIVFIGAHGDIAPEGLFFRVVADEKSGRFSAHQLARHVASAGVVILAVCNGGRVDVDPFGRATVGLARLLLDHGCRAVIGAPWSLDLSVVRRWLPAFLRAYDGGATLIEANHAGNRAVMEFSHHPVFSLSMNLMGDPLLAH